MSADNKENIAKKFGEYLDQDDFENFKKILSKNCIYHIAEQVLEGRKSVSSLYEKNMKEGKAKFDKLVWGKSETVKINEHQFEVYFSDFLMHKGIEHHYKCKQRISINQNKLVEKILHIELPGEKESLTMFYEKVGLNN